MCRFVKNGGKGKFIAPFHFNPFLEFTELFKYATLFEAKNDFTLS